MQLTYMIKNILASFSTLNSHFTYPNPFFLALVEQIKDKKKTQQNTEKNYLLAA